MNPLPKLIQETHRRSLWRVLGVYLVGSWAAYQGVLALVQGFGLPGWVTPFAGVLVLVGVPIVLATAVVQERAPTPRDLLGARSGDPLEPHLLLEPAASPAGPRIASLARRIPGPVLTAVVRPIVRVILAAALIGGLPLAGAAQQPVEAAAPAAQAPPAADDPLFHTFSIVAIDPVTGESGVAVTTRVPCVGNGVPWTRAGAGAVATQAWTRVEYGPELLDLMEAGVAPEQALAQRLAADERRERRQVGAIGPDGRTTQHTGEETTPWAGHRAGPNYATQGNLLVGPEVLEAVARTFEASAGSPRHLADRLIEALAAGQAAGGDARKGRLQSAAVVVADPRPGISRRPDGITTQINVCEHPNPVAELRRIHDTVSQTLGYRTLRQYAGSDVWQLKVMLHALGFFRPDAPALERGDDAELYTPEAVAAVDRFRAEQGLSTPDLGSPPGLVDDETVARLWAELERTGKAEAVRRELLDVVRVRR